MFSLAFSDLGSKKEELTAVDILLMVYMAVHFGSDNILANIL